MHSMDADATSQLLKRYSNVEEEDTLLDDPLLNKKKLTDTQVFLSKPM